MGNLYQYSVEERFLRYVQVDTQSDPFSSSFPSTEKQKDLGHILVTELLAFGLADAHMDEHGYVFATIPSNSLQDVPVIICSSKSQETDRIGTGRRRRSPYGHTR